MINEVMRKPFPKNLMEDLGVYDHRYTPDDFYPSLMYVLHLLTDERNISLMLSRYVEGHTYEEIGAEFGLTRQRVHDIINTLIDKMGGLYTDILTVGINNYYYAKVSERAIELAHKVDDYNISKYTATSAIAKMDNTGVSSSVLDEISIKELGMSTRLYNSLARNRVTTLGKIIRLGDGIINVKTFGKECFAELARILQEYNVDIMGTFPTACKKYEWSEANG